MMKETRKQADDRELQFLQESDSLTPNELAVIRRLNGATMVQGSKLSRRTIEAILQGRRSNARVLQMAIHNSIKVLEAQKATMDGILEKMRNWETKKQENGKY